MPRYDDENPTRDPLPPPFAVGTRLRCVDKNASPLRYGRDGVKHPERTPTDGYVTVYEYGLVVTIDEVRVGHHGTGREVDLKDGEEPFIDSTSDGYSVYHVEGTKHGRCIFAEDKNKWEVVK